MFPPLSGSPQKDSAERKRNAAYFLLVLSLFFTGMTIFAVSQRLVRKSFAVCSNPTVRFTTDVPPPLVVGNNFNLIIDLDPNGCEVNAFKLKFSFDPQILELQDLQDIGANVMQMNMPLMTQSNLMESRTMQIEGGPVNAMYTNRQNVLAVRMRVKPDIDVGVGTTTPVLWAQDTEIMDLTSNREDAELPIVNAYSGIPPLTSPTAEPGTPTPTPKGIEFMGLQLGAIRGNKGLKIFELLFGL